MLRRLLAASLALAAGALAATIRVPGDQPTIQAGIDAAAEGDTVLVAPGTYSGPGNKSINFRGIDRTLVSEAGPRNTVISPTGRGRGFRFKNGETRAALVRGFTVSDARPILGGGGAICCEHSSPTIMNCILTRNGGEYSGGGIYCDSASPIIANCIISHNDGEVGGGGISCGIGSSPIILNCEISENIAIMYGGGLSCHRGCEATIENCIVTGNTAASGGGLYCSGANPTITNCTISDNRAPNSVPPSGHGGGLNCDDSSPTMTNCTVSRNRANISGGGLWCGFSSSPRLTNCIINGNSADYAAGLRCGRSSPALANCVLSGNMASSYAGGGISTFLSSYPVLTNCILWGDTPDEVYNEPSNPGDPTLTYCNVLGGWSGQGNINAPPLFRYIRGFDYVLGPNSSCIDAGDPTIRDGISDWHPRWPDWYPNGPRSDMGAYGGPGNWRWLR